MSFPYPQDRNRDRREKGQQPYQAARQTMAEEEASLKAEAEAFGEAHLYQTDEEKMANLEAEAVESMRRVGDDRRHGEKHP
jgi:hypothetical protein